MLLPALTLHPPPPIKGDHSFLFVCLLPAEYLEGIQPLPGEHSVDHWGAGLESENVAVALSVDSQKQTNQENL